MIPYWIGFLIWTGSAFAAAPEQAIEFYANGSLVQANGLDSFGEGFVRIFQQRDRGWTSEDMQRLVSDSARETTARFPGLERLQLGDFSGQYGGFISGHVSHQNGLDADLSYFRVNHREQAIDSDTGFDEPFVLGGKITPNFDTERNWEFISFMISSGLVTRIFMDSAIKLTFCQYVGANSGGYQSPETTEALRKLRPYNGHQAHMHVRIACPSTSPRCRPQDPAPPGDGCAELGGADPMGGFGILDWFLLRRVDLEIPE